jgi:dUTP pyrophosphatase
MEEVKIKIKKLYEEDIPLPCYMTEHSAGMDLYAYLDKDLEIKPGERRLISTGIAIAIPSGYEAQIRPRSGLAFKYGLTLLNSPGTIDADFRGEIGIILINHGKEAYILKRGERIAQMVINRVLKANLELIDKLPESKRGKGGFGHTGV